MFIELTRSPLSRADEATSNQRSVRGRDYKARAGPAVEREIRGLKELGSDWVTSHITGRQFTEGWFPTANSLWEKRTEA